MARGEFELIEAYFAPLAAGHVGTFDLKNDAGLLSHRLDQSLVSTVDCLVEGVHFRADDPPADVARKALRVNLSDLAAMGAVPVAYLLAIALPSPLDESWLESFSKGLAQDQAEFGIYLLGGDTTRTPGPRSLSVTALGTVPARRCLERATAGPGDLVFVSGTLRDAALGLKALLGSLDGLEAEPRELLVSRYRLPQPRLDLGPALLAGGLATAAIDVSDGLVADMGHIAEDSGLGAELARDRLPLSEAARKALASDETLWAEILTGGDDYELLFTVARDDAEKVEVLSDELGLELTEIGRMTQGQGVAVSDPDGRPMTLEAPGWRHF